VTVLQQKKKRIKLEVAKILGRKRIAWSQIRKLSKGLCSEWFFEKENRYVKSDRMHQTGNVEILRIYLVRGEHIGKKISSLISIKEKAQSLQTRIVKGICLAIM